MARLVVEISDRLVERIWSLVDRGRYESLHTFLAVAAENQLLLEQGEGPGQKAWQHTSGGRASALWPAGKDVAGLEEDEASRALQMLRIEGEHRGHTKPVKLAQAGDFNPVWGERNPMWGQINRVFPTKTGVRFLSNLLAADGSQAVPLEAFRTAAARVAAALGHRVRLLDDVAGRKRDQAHSTGLPSGKRGPANFEKSLERYKNQFLVYVRTDCSVDGALARLKFAAVRVSDSGDAEILITEPGWMFAQLTNPILDETGGEGTLSAEEVRFYLDHVKRHVPSEAEAMAAILQLIGRGVSRPDHLNEELVEIWRGREWSQQVINTQRSGLTARMIELGLLSKKKDGMEVSYFITDLGREFVQRTESA